MASAQSTVYFPNKPASRSSEKTLSVASTDSISQYLAKPETMW